MHILLSFFRQEVPKDSTETHYYYNHSLKITDRILFIYFSLSVIVLSVLTGHFQWVPLVPFLCLLIVHFRENSFPSRINLFLHIVILCLWISWYVSFFGWGIGGQHMLIVLLLLVFFCIYETPFGKILYFLALLTLRISLYIYASNHSPSISLDDFSLLILQTVNTVCAFTILALLCIIFSGNLQESERLLLLKNEQLHLQAETDPLTKLVNRRGLHDIMNCYVLNNPAEMYCVAIADIDFFKRVNDTYGHNCGDYVLQELSSLFRSHAEKNGFSVGRWGGEEFCFFFPGINIDDAGRYINDILIAVRKMPLDYEDHHFFITVTAGVEENDYRSPLDQLIESADRKLYLGKNNGRDQIVF